MGKLTPMRHPYLFGGGISVLLIAGAVFAFVSTVAVVSQQGLPGTTSSISASQEGSLTVDAGPGIVGEHANDNAVASPPRAFASARPLGPVSAPPAANRRNQQSPSTSANPSQANGGTDTGGDTGPTGGGPTPGNPGQGGRPPAPGDGSPTPAPGQAAPPAGPPGLAKKPGGLPPGQAKKSGGLPPGLAKKPDGLPPGQAKKLDGGPPGHAPH